MQAVARLLLLGSWEELSVIVCKPIRCIAGKHSFSFCGLHLQLIVSLAVQNHFSFVESYLLIAAKTVGQVKSYLETEGWGGCVKEWTVRLTLQNPGENYKDGEVECGVREACGQEQAKQGLMEA